MNPVTIILKPLVVADADFLHRLYTEPGVADSYSDAPFSDGESPVAFTERLISFCEAIFTIRKAASPEKAIGDCALHHFNKDTKEIEIGGSLLPEYWGKGYMYEAFDLLTKFAKEKFGASVLIGNTEITNLKAARLVGKMGFEKYKVEGKNILFRKFI